MNTFAKIQSILTPVEAKSAIILFCLMTIGMVLEMLGVGMLFPVIVLMGEKDLALQHPRIQPVLDYLGNPTQSQLVIGAMVALVGVYLIKNLFLAFIAWRQARFINGVQAQLMQRLFSAYMQQPYSFHLQRNSAQLGHNIGGETVVFSALINISMIMFIDGLTLFGVATLLLMAEPLGVLLVGVVLGGAVWGFYYCTRSRVTRWGVARQYHAGLRSQHLYQGLGGVKDIILLGRESNFLEQFQLHSNKEARVTGSQAILQQLPRLWLELLAVFGLATLVLSMLAQGIGIDRIMPTVGLFAAAAFRLLPMVNRMLAGVQTIRFNFPSASLIYEEFKLIEIEPSIVKVKDTVVYHEFKTNISLLNICYSYPGTAKAALDSVSITIKKGESVGFIGISGSGKSTLVDVILGLLLPSDGQIMVDGQNIQEDLRTWQNQIGYVPQSIYLTDDTLRRNVAFGLADKQIDDVAIQRAIKDAQLDEFIDSLPDGLETIVGERGVRLSGGQRQRIGIARALYHNPSVLVLDEATSALDTATEQGVMQAVMALQGRKTILIVAHRLSTVERCDRLYRLEQGRLVAEGTPLEMLATVLH